MSNEDYFYERYHGDLDRLFDEYRSEYMRDEARVAHSFAFRRLQGKTQIFGIEQGDFHRNRMTHSIEVASIARSITACVRNKLKNKNDTLSKELGELLYENEAEYNYLISAICLLHDVGHPPFGHAGEVALNYKVYSENTEGFEGNAQTFRLVSNLEQYSKSKGNESGLNLTRRVLLGILKYPVKYKSLLNSSYPEKNTLNRKIDIAKWKPPKCYYNEDSKVFDWVLKPFDGDKNKFTSSEIDQDANTGHKKSIYKSFDCSIMDAADDIANSVHDLEDAIFYDMIKREDLLVPDIKDMRIFKPEEYEWYEDISSKDFIRRKKAFRYMIHCLINSIEFKSHNVFEAPVLNNYVSFSEDALAAIKKLKTLIKKNTYETQEVETIVYGGMMTIMQLFDAIISNPRKLLPHTFVEKLNQNNPLSTERIVCDYIAGMTDEYARRLHDRIYGDTPGSVFEKL